MRLHFLEASCPGGDREPLLIAPGTAEIAEDYRDLMTSLSDRQCVAMSFRGRATTGGPQLLYRLDNHVDDINTIANHVGLPRFALLGYSRSVAYVVAYALTHPDRVAGLVLGDYPPRQSTPAGDWPERMHASTTRGVPVASRMSLSTLQAIQRDADPMNLTDRLGELACPVLVIRGGKPGSLLSDESAASYRDHLRRGEIVTLRDADHRLWLPSLTPYAEAIRTFLTRLDH